MECFPRLKDISRRGEIRNDTLAKNEHHLRHCLQCESVCVRLFVYQSIFPQIAFLDEYYR